MEAQTVSPVSLYEQTLVSIIRRLPAERASQIVDFARFIEYQTFQVDTEDALPDEQETEEEILADEARWEAQFAASRDKLRRLAAEAREEIRAGRTYEMIFTAEGRIAPG